MFGTVGNATTLLLEEHTSPLLKRVRLLQGLPASSLGFRSIRVKLVLKYEDEWMLSAVYKACLQEAAAEPRGRVSVKIVDNRLLLLFKGSKPPKVAERLRNILGLINMAEQAVFLLEAV